MRTHLGCQSVEIGGLTSAAGAVLTKRAAKAAMCCAQGAGNGAAISDGSPAEEWQIPQAEQAPEPCALSAPQSCALLGVQWPAVSWTAWCSECSESLPLWFGWAVRWLLTAGVPCSGTEGCECAVCDAGITGATTPMAIALPSRPRRTNVMTSKKDNQVRIGWMEARA